VLEWVESAGGGVIGYWEVSALTGHKVHTLAQHLANAAAHNTSIGVVRSCRQNQNHARTHGIHRPPSPGPCLGLWARSLASDSGRGVM
jgi:hypothetical protein